MEAAFFGAAFLEAAFFGAAFLEVAFFGAAFLEAAFLEAGRFRAVFAALVGDFFLAVSLEATVFPVFFRADMRASMPDPRLNATADFEGPRTGHPSRHRSIRRAGQSASHPEQRFMAAPLGPRRATLRHSSSKYSGYSSSSFLDSRADGSRGAATHCCSG